MNDPVMSSVTQPPSGNLIHTVRHRIEAVSRNPTPFIPSPNSHPCASWRSFHQCTHIPNWEREKVMNTLMEYMMMRYFTDPPGMYSISHAIPPLNKVRYFA